MLTQPENNKIWENSWGSKWADVLHFHAFSGRRKQAKKFQCREHEKFKNSSLNKIKLLSLFLLTRKISLCVRCLLGDALEPSHFPLLCAGDANFFNGTHFQRQKTISVNFCHEWQDHKFSLLPSSPSSLCNFTILSIWKVPKRDKAENFQASMNMKGRKFGKRIFILRVCAE